MFITVRFGDDQREIFNPYSKVCALLDNIKERCDCKKDDVVDLSDASGVRKNLTVSPMDYATKYLNEREVFILVKIEKFPGSLKESCIPLLHNLQGDKDFLENLNKSMNEEPDLEEKVDRSKRNIGRRGSMNLRRSPNTLAVGGASKRNRTTRSQSVAFGAGTNFLKPPRNTRY